MTLYSPSQVWTGRVIGSTRKSIWKQYLLWRTSSSEVNVNEVHMVALLKELWAYMRARKKWWLMPAIVVLVVFGGILLLAQGTAVAPFIYTIF